MNQSHQDSIHNYLQTAVIIRESVENLSPHLLSWKPTATAWSIQEIVGHLIDSNITNSYRIRKIISEPVSPIATFAHEGWVDQQQFNDFSLTELLDIYDAITKYNGILLSKLSEEQWLSVGMKGDEQISIVHIIDKFICNHVSKHIGQIARNIGAFEAI